MRRDAILLFSRRRSDSLLPAGDSVWWKPGKKSYDDMEQVSQFFAEYIDDGRRKLLNFDSKQIDVDGGRRAQSNKEFADDGADK